MNPRSSAAVIVIVGRPNVGKSTLFNVLTKSRDALVADFPGVTRDRLMGHARCDDRDCIIIDTGGIADAENSVEQNMQLQTKVAIQDADAILFLVDGRDGLCPQDQIIARQLRQAQVPVFLVVNKTEGVVPELALAEFAELGFANNFAISSAHKTGTNDLLATVLEADLQNSQDLNTVIPEGIKIAVVGRPNVGKSTLVNRLLGEDRVIAQDQAGTTRDSIYIPFQHHDESYVLIDTAGLRRKARVTDTIEKFAALKSMQAMEAADVVLLLIDAQKELATQDLHILSYIIEKGKAVILVVNKWDKLPEEQKQKIRDELNYRLRFANYFDILFISALYGSNVGNLYNAISKSYANATKELSTSQLTELLESAVAKHQPPMSKGNRIKLRLAHPGGQNPLTIIIHGNQTEALPDSYKKYLENFFRQALKVHGAPLRLIFKTGTNPYAGRRNKLTPRQQRKRQRLMKFNKQR